MTDRQQLKSVYDPMDLGFPPPKKGYTRIFEDQTGRWYQDYSPVEMTEMNNDPLMILLKEEITKEINREIIETICGKART